MVRVGLVLVLGAIVTSMAVAMYMYVQYQPNIIVTSHGEPVAVGPIEYAITYQGTYDGNDDVKPQNTFVRIRIDMRNLDTQDVRVSGGQFYFVDDTGEKRQPTYGNGTFGQEDLLTEVLKPDRTVSRTTQFDVPFDRDARYDIMIRPAKDHSTIDTAIVCITNCQ